MRRGRTRCHSEALIINRNTYDYNFNSAINPVLHIGDASINSIPACSSRYGGTATIRPV